MPEDVGDAFEWLASDRARSVTGVELPVDAGHRRQATLPAQPFPSERVPLNPMAAPGVARSASPADILAPTSILVIGPDGAGNRTGRTLAALRARAGNERVAYVRAAGTPVSVSAEISALKRRGGFGCVLCYGLTPDFIATCLEAIVELGTRLIVLGSGETKGLSMLVLKARALGVRVLGPNGYGPFVGDQGLFINPLPELRPSGLAVLTQSGNMVLDVLASLRHLAGAAPRLAWGIGASADLGLADSIDIAADDPLCTAIAVHGEGFTEGGELLRAVARATRRKPVVLLQGGTTAAGSASALSHTGGLSTSRALVSGLFGQAGAALVARSDEFAALGFALSLLHDASAERVAVVADGGGQATLMMDALSDRGVAFAEFSAETEARLGAVVGTDAHIANPLDVGISPVERPTAAIDAVREVLETSEADCVVIVGVIGSYSTHFDSPELESIEAEAAAALAERAADLGKSLIFVSSYAADLPPSYRRLLEAGVPVLGSIDIAASLVQKMRERTSFLRSAAERSDFSSARPGRIPEDDVDAATLLDEAASRSALTGYGLDLGPFAVVASAEQARAAMEDGRDYVIKIVSPDIPHKSDVGGVRLRVSRSNAEREYELLLADVSANAPQARIAGVSVAPMAESGVEIIVGAYRDARFGACIAVGSGGVLAELIRDTVIRSAPVTALEAEEMVEATRSARLLEGYRGAAPADKEGLVRVIVKLSEIVAAHPEVREIDLNPVIVSPSSPQAVDARVVTSRKEERK